VQKKGVLKTKQNGKKGRWGRLEEARWEIKLWMRVPYGFREIKKWPSCGREKS